MIPIALGVILVGAAVLALLLMWALHRWDQCRGELARTRIQRDHAQQQLTSLRAEVTLTAEACDRAQARAASYLAELEALTLGAPTWTPPPAGPLDGDLTPWAATLRDIDALPTTKEDPR